MTPRLASSVEWSPLPTEYAQKIAEVFSQTYPLQTRQGRFIIEGRIYKAEILVRIGYVRQNQLTQINFESSVDFDFQKQKAQDRIGLSVDAIGQWFDDYFEKEETYEYPRRWEEQEMDGDLVYMQFSTVNTNLEQEANRLLGLAAGEELFNAEFKPNEEDALERAVIDTDLAQEIQEKIREGHDLH